MNISWCSLWNAILFGRDNTSIHPRRVVHTATSQTLMICECLELLYSHCKAARQSIAGEDHKITFSAEKQTIHLISCWESYKSKVSILTCGGIRLCISIRFDQSHLFHLLHPRKYIVWSRYFVLLNNLDFMGRLSIRND